MISAKLWTIKTVLEGNRHLTLVQPRLSRFSLDGIITIPKQRRILIYAYSINAPPNKPEHG